MLATYLGFSKKTEIILIAFLGISFLSVDLSLFELTRNIEKLRSLKLEKLKYLEPIIKYVLILIESTKAMSLYVFLVFYMIMLWAVLFEEKFTLIVPWLLLGFVRCLILNALTFSLGLLICQSELSGFNLVCFEYVVAEIIEHGPSVYAWLTVLDYYREITKKCQAKESVYSNALENRSKSKLKSFSMSNLNLDYIICNDRVKNLPGEVSIENFMTELKEFCTKNRIIRGSSKSFDSLIQANNQNLKQCSATVYTSLSVLTKSMKTLELSDNDILEAKKHGNNFARVLLDISLSDINQRLKSGNNTVSTKNATLFKNQLCKRQKAHYLSKSCSEAEEDLCLDHIRRQLQIEQSNQTLFECEIAIVSLNEEENGNKHLAGIDLKSENMRKP